MVLSSSLPGEAGRASEARRATRRSGIHPIVSSPLTSSLVSKRLTVFSEPRLDRLSAPWTSLHLEFRRRFQEETSRTILSMETVEMENGFVRVGAIGQSHPESTCGTKSRLWQINNQSVTKDELICSEPHHARSITFILHGCNRFGSKLTKRDCDLQILDFILTEDDGEDDSEASNQVGFFCGSPPVRTSNPVVYDPQFDKQTISVASPLGIPPLVRPTVKRGSPSCGISGGSKPKVRVEGFTCGSPESHHAVVPALA